MRSHQTRNTIYLKTSLIYLFLLITILPSCKKEKDDNSSNAAIPEVRIIEIGISNSNIAFLGMEFPIKATIEAPNSIDYIHLTIEPQDNQPWGLDTLITDVYQNETEITFDEMIFIPAGTPLGHYHLHIFVTDKAKLVSIDAWDNIFLENF